LNSEFQKPKDGIYFIARDPVIFEYVLEYLIYEHLVSDIQETNILKKLILDADFYLLPNLKQEAEAQLKNHPGVTQNSKIPLSIHAKFDNGTHGGNGQYWQWNNITAMPEEFFSRTTESYSNDTITIKKAGTYLILIRTAFTNSTNGLYLSLYINGSDVARCYNNFNTGYSASTQINEVFQVNANTKLQVYQSYNSAPINSNPNNQFSIVCLGLK